MPTLVVIFTQSDTTELLNMHDDNLNMKNQVENSIILRTKCMSSLSTNTYKLQSNIQCYMYRLHTEVPGVYAIYTY